MQQAAYAQFAVGIAGIIGCLCVLAVLFAHGRDRRSLRDRILAGMFVSNIVYSLSFVIPANWFDSSGPAIGTGPNAQCELVVSMTTYSTAYGFMLSGKFMMVMYELFIVAASVIALRTGATELGKWTERACHGACVSTGVAVFIAWVVVQVPRLITAIRLLKRAKTADTPQGATTDTAMGLAHAEAWDATYSAYLQAWVGVFALVVATWIYQRFVLLRRRTAEWNTSLVEAAGEWDRDLWKTSDPWCNDFDIMWAISHGVPQLHASLHASWGVPGA